VTARSGALGVGILRDSGSALGLLVARQTGRWGQLELARPRLAPGGGRPLDLLRQPTSGRRQRHGSGVTSVLRRHTPLLWRDSGSEPCWSTLPRQPFMSSTAALKPVFSPPNGALRPAYWMTPGGLISGSCGTPTNSISSGAVHNLWTALSTSGRGRDLWASFSMPRTGALAFQIHASVSLLLAVASVLLPPRLPKGELGRGSSTAGC